MKPDEYEEFKKWYDGHKNSPEDLVKELEKYTDHEFVTNEQLENFKNLNVDDQNSMIRML